MFEQFYLYGFLDGTGFFALAMGPEHDRVGDAGFKKGRFVFLDEPEVLIEAEACNLGIDVDRSGDFAQGRFHEELAVALLAVGRQDSDPFQLHPFAGLADPGRSDGKIFIKEQEVAG